MGANEIILHTFVITFPVALVCAFVFTKFQERIKGLFRRKTVVTMDVTLVLDGNEYTYHYRGTPDEMMTMLNHVPVARTMIDGKRIEQCNIYVKEE